MSLQCLLFFSSPHNLFNRFQIVWIKNPMQHTSTAKEKKISMSYFYFVIVNQLLVFTVPLLWRHFLACKRSSIMMILFTSFAEINTFCYYAMESTISWNSSSFPLSTYICHSLADWNQEDFAVSFGDFTPWTKAMPWNSLALAWLLSSVFIINYPSTISLGSVMFKSWQDI